MALLDPVTRRIAAGDGPARTVCLMYHGTPDKGKSFASEYSIAADRVAEQMDYLVEAGWKTVPASELLNPDRPGGKTVAITFDDGYADNYENAFLPLQERGLTATWFIASKYLDGQADWLADEPENLRFLSGEQVREMASAGMEIGSHSHSHPHLDTLDRDSLEAELSRSKEELEDIIGRPVTAFAYPFGQYNEFVVEAVREAGYTQAFTTQPGWFNPQESPLLMRRITITRHDDINSFVRKLSFGDNEVGWQGLVDYGMRRVAAKLRGR